MFYFKSDYLDELATKYHLTYSQAQPFPHIVIDNFIPEQFLELVLNEFPQVNTVEWQKFTTIKEKKLASSSELHMGEMTRFLLYQFNSSIFLEFLEKLTGIKGIIPDPYFWGGGLHQIERGGFLKIHADFNYYPKLSLDRRLNLLLYLNKNWQEEDGGHLELWDQKMENCHQRILPIFNRCVIFNTTDFSYHGHPDPLTCPEGNTRKSLALYYYSNGRPAEEVSEHHTTLFKARMGENLEEKITGKELIKKLIPPIVIDLKNKVLKK